MKGFRFGVYTPQWKPYQVLLDNWRYFEELGFDSIWPCDHFHNPGHPDKPFFEGWTVLAALAAETSRIRVGVLVSSNTFRHPALLAQQAITLDHVSEGRLDFGVGAGWYE
ncbi:MAG: LLM class flavin-dependent oxidoreductase, partial [bacterium]|nr:LLM class flavin-dependent oxidoreductase [bacterium]